MKKILFPLIASAALLASCTNPTTTPTTISTGSVTTPVTSTAAVTTGSISSGNTVATSWVAVANSFKNFINDTQAYFTKKYPSITISDASKIEADKLNIRTVNTGPVYHILNKKYYYGDNEGITTFYTPGKWLAVSLEDLNTEIKNILTASGLAKVDTINYSADNAIQDIYEGNDIVCSLDTARLPQENITLPVGLACGKKLSSTELAELEKVIALLPNTNQKTIVSAPEIINNIGRNEYEAAKLHIHTIEWGGEYALLYRKKWEDWKLFKTTQESPFCKDYNTDELKNAFAGIECYDDANRISTLK